MFFKRILSKQPEPAVPPPEAPAVERRGEQRHAISPDFPLRAVLSFIGRDESGAPMSESRQGWNWKGRLIDLSEDGARLQLGPAVKVRAGEPCDLLLAVQDYELMLPCRVTNLTEHPDGIIVGLNHVIEDAAVLNGYRQLVEVVALGSTLRLQAKGAQPDVSGYLVETYASLRGSRLTVWRHPADRSVGAFELVLQDNLVRAAAGRTVEFMSDIDGSGSRPASAEKCLEIGRLFRWVVPNLPPEIPADLRAFLQQHAG
jgi:hypothetical protein